MSQHVFGRIEFEYDTTTGVAAGDLQARFNEFLTNYLAPDAVDETLGVWARVEVDGVRAIWGADSVFQAVA